MKITIITATYNSELHIADCLQSVANQSYKNIEHIIVDGSSTDSTMEIVKAAPSVTKYISEPDKGIYDALNKGIKMATGDVIGFVHSDDMLAASTTIATIAKGFLFPPFVTNIQQTEKGNIPRQNNIVDKAPDGVYGNLVFIDTEDTDKTVRTWRSKPFHRKNIKHGWMPPHPTLFLSKEVYQKYGLFDISFKIAGDYDFMLRVMLDKDNHLEYIPETIVKMRKGGASTGNFCGLITKKKEDIRAMKNNGFRFPFKILVFKNLRKVPQLFIK